MSYNSRRSPVLAIHGVASSSQHLASEVGLRILRGGGNCVDACVAMAAALNVTEPTSTGIGGDAFCLHFDKESGEVSAMNASGRAPAALTIEVVEAATGRKFPDLMPQPGEPGIQHAVTVPGACAGWCDAVDKWGSMSMAEVLAPAIELADGGFPVHQLTAAAWSKAAELLRDMPNGTELLQPGLEPDSWRGPEEGDIWTNKTLAQTFREVASKGKAGFYEGRIAEALVEVLTSLGGVMTAQDLAEHTSTFPEPIMTEYRGIEVWEVPPNTQGLTALIALNILEGFDVASMDETTRLHTMIETMRLAFADTQYYVTDTDIHSCPTSQLLSKKYASARRALIDPDKTFEDVTYGTPAASSGTVYFCCTDSTGNACSFINSNYMGVGTGIVPKGCGFTLQNRGGNFSLDPAHPNALAPRKRPYHTIIPGMATIPASSSDDSGQITKRQLYCAFGVMGGFMQPQGHMQVISNMVDFGMTPQAALDAPRFCVAPNGEGVGRGVLVALEDGIADDVVAALKGKGHNIKLLQGAQRSTFGRGQIIRVHPKSGVWWAGSDPRADGCAIGW